MRVESRRGSGLRELRQPDPGLVSGLFHPGLFRRALPSGCPETLVSPAQHDRLGCVGPLVCRNVDFPPPPSESTDHQASPGHPGLGVSVSVSRQFLDSSGGWIWGCSLDSSLDSSFDSSRNRDPFWNTSAGARERSSLTALRMDRFVGQRVLQPCRPWPHGFQHRCAWHQHFWSITHLGAGSHSTTRQDEPDHIFRDAR